MELTTPFIDQVIEHSPVSMQVLDRDGMTVRVNGPFLRLFGLRERAEIEGVINLRTHPSIAAHGLAEALDRAYRGEVVHTPAAPFNSGYGPTRVVRAVIFPVTDETGAVERVILIHEDVTELQAKESALERRYQQITALQQAFRNIGEVLHTDAVLEGALSAMEHLCASDAVAVWRQEGGSWVSLAAHGLSDRYRREVTEAYAQAPPFWHSPFEEIRKNQAVYVEDTMTDPLVGGLRPVLEREGIRRVLALPMHSGDAVDGAIIFYGRTPGAFDPVDVEVAQLLADQTAIALHNAYLLQQARAAEMEARILYHTSSLLAQSLSLPDVLSALTGEVAPLMGVQRVIVSSLDEERDEIRIIAHTGLDGSQLSERAYDGFSRLSALPERFRRVVSTGEPLVLIDVREMLSELSDEQRADLERFNVCSILAVALREGGRTIGTMSFDSPGVVRRWTEQDVRICHGIATQAAAAMRNARLFEEVRASREQLEERVRERTSELRVAHNEVIASERLAAIGIMAREVGHGLRNPLNVIATSLYYVRSRFPEPDEKVERHFDTITRAVDQSANMINQLMSLAGPRRPEMAPVDLNQLVRRALQDRFTAEEVRWTAEWDEGLPYVSGDWVQLNHAVKALIGNAAGAYDPERTPGSERLPIRIRTGRDGDSAFLEVGDHRAHLDEEAQRALFEPFSVSATQWTGLGLSVAMQIAGKHGGNVTVSEVNGMTWFRMTLPFADHEADKADGSYDSGVLGD